MSDVGMAGWRDAPYTEQLRPPVEITQYRDFGIGEASAKDIQYESLAEVTEMARAKPQEVVTWGTFQWVVSGLLGVIAVLFGLAYYHLINDVGTIRETTQTVARELTQTKLDLVNAIANVQKETAITNTKLDSVIEELRRPKDQRR